MYAITATVSDTGDGWNSTRQVPTFHLDESVQGIVSADHAARIARSVIDPYGMFETHVSALKVDPPLVEGRVTTWANGFGIWHVRVPRHAVAPLVAARRALRGELQLREKNVRPDIWMRPERVEDLDTEDTIVYRENTQDQADEHTDPAAAFTIVRRVTYPTPPSGEVRISVTDETDEVKRLLEDWIGTCLSHIADTSTNITGGYAHFVDEARERAAAVGIPWSDELIPGHVWDQISRAAEKGAL